MSSNNVWGYLEERGAQRVITIPETRFGWPTLVCWHADIIHHGTTWMSDAVKVALDGVPRTEWTPVFNNVSLHEWCFVYDCWSIMPRNDEEDVRSQVIRIIGAAREAYKTAHPEGEDNVG